MVPGWRPRGGVEGQNAGRGIGRPAVHQGGTGHVCSPVQVPHGVHDAVPARSEGKAEPGDEVIGPGVGYALPPEAVQQRGGCLPGSGLRPFEGVDHQFDFDGIPEGRIEPLAEMEQLVCGEPDKEGGRIGPVPVPGQLRMVRQRFPLVGLLRIGAKPFRCRASDEAAEAEQDQHPHTRGQARPAPRRPSAAIGIGRSGHHRGAIWRGSV